MENIETLAKYMRAVGAKTYVVGGAVRDAILGLPNKDIDALVTGLPVSTLETALSHIPEVVDVDLVGKSFGVFKVKFADGEILDVAVPRTERSTGKGHRDFEVVTDETLTVEDDLARRDFTMNAIAVEITELGATTIDPFGGVLDILARTIRTVGVAEERFGEDPLRILRAMRFKARYGFKLERWTEAAVVDLAPTLNTLSNDRVGEEFAKVLAGKHAHEAISFMARTGLLETIVPEWTASVGFEQNNPHHYAPVDIHVLDAFRYVVAAGGSLRARLAVLLHDISKPATYSVDANGVGHFYGHEAEGPKVARDILTRLRFPEADIRAVCTIIREHLRPPKVASQKALRKYVADLGEHVEDALMCKAGDLAAHVLPEGFDVVEWHQATLEAIAALPKELSGFDQKKLALSGGEIYRTFGVKGVEVGKLKTYAAQAVVEGVVENEASAILAFLTAEREAGRV